MTERQSVHPKSKFVFNDSVVKAVNVSLNYLSNLPTNADLAGMFVLSAKRQAIERPNCNKLLIFTNLLFISFKMPFFSRPKCYRSNNRTFHL